MSTLTDNRKVQKRTNKKQVSWVTSQGQPRGIWKVPLIYWGLLWSPTDGPDSLRQKKHIWNCALQLFQPNTQHKQLLGWAEVSGSLQACFFKKFTSARFCKMSLQFFFHNSIGEAKLPLISLTRGNLGWVYLSLTRTNCLSALVYTKCCYFYSFHLYNL